MTTNEAHSYGHDQGFNAAIYCEVDNTDRRDAGCECKPKALATEYVSVNETSECEECLTVAAFESEQNARQFSPFEFFASDVNSSDNCAELWESYDKGVTDGIKAGIKDRIKAR